MGPSEDRPVRVNDAVELSAISPQTIPAGGGVMYTPLIAAILLVLYSFCLQHIVLTHNTPSWCELPLLQQEYPGAASGHLGSSAIL